MRWMAVIGLLFAVQACGKSPPAQAASPAPPADSTERAPEDSLTMTGLTLEMYAYQPTGEDAERPTFRVSAREGHKQQDRNIWSLRGVKAVANSDQGEVFLDAEEAEFNEDDSLARLSGGVSVRSGAMEISAEEIKWDNTAEKIRSDQPVSVTDGRGNVSAESLEFDPNTRKLSMKNMVGRFSLENP